MDFWTAGSEQHYLCLLLVLDTRCRQYDIQRLIASNCCYCSNMDSTGHSVSLTIAEMWATVIPAFLADFTQHLLFRPSAHSQHLEQMNKYTFKVLWFELWLFTNKTKPLQWAVEIELWCKLQLSKKRRILAAPSFTCKSYVGYFHFSSCASFSSKDIKKQG